MSLQKANKSNNRDYYTGMAVKQDSQQHWYASVLKTEVSADFELLVND